MDGVIAVPEKPGSIPRESKDGGKGGEGKTGNNQKKMRIGYSWIERPVIFLSVIFSIFLIIFGLTFRFSYDEYQEALDKAIENSQAEARFVSSIVSAYQEQHLKVLQSYADRSLLIEAVKKRDFNGVIGHFASMKNRNPGMESAITFDKSGIAWAQFPMHKGIHETNLSHGDWHPGVSEKWKPHISGVRKQMMGEGLTVLTCIPILDEKGAPIGILGVSQSNKAFERLINVVGFYPDATVTLIDQHGKIIVSNRKGKQVPYTEIKDYPFFDSMRKVMDEKKVIRIRDPDRGGELMYVAFQPIEMTGWWVTVELDHGSALKSEYPIILEGWAVSFLVFLVVCSGLVHLRRTTVRARNEEEVRKEAAALRERAAIVDAVGDGLLVHDMEGRITHINPTMEKMLGYRNLDVVGKLASDLIREVVKVDDIGTNLNALQDTLEGKVPQSKFFHFVAKDGREIPVAFTTSFIRNLENKSTAAVVAFKDLSELKQAEEQLRQYAENLEKMVEERTERVQELERRRLEGEKSAAIGRMAARIAHEINNPLAGVKNSFRLIRDAVPEDYPYHKYVGLIDREIDRIAHILSQMYDLYRPERDVTREASVEEMIFSVISLLNVSNQDLKENRKRIEVETGDQSILMTLREGSFRQILYSLIENAIDASPPGGVVRVTASATKEAVNITVSDSGGGIPEELRSKIFEPFFTTKEGLDRRGLGLGLSISRSLVEKMGGSIDFTSELGKGTVFKVALPVTP